MISVQGVFVLAQAVSEIYEVFCSKLPSQLYYITFQGLFEVQSGRMLVSGEMIYLDTLRAGNSLTSKLMVYITCFQFLKKIQS